MKLRLKQGIRTLLLSPAGLFLRLLSEGRGTCVMYHRLQRGGPLVPGFNPNLELMVSEERFDEQMAYLARNHACLTISEAIEALTRGRLPRRSVVVTFDDVHRDCLTLALPILRRHRVPATLYVTTGITDGTASLWWYEQETLLRQLDRLELNWRGKPIRRGLSTDAEKQAAFLELNRLFKSLAAKDQEEFMKELRAATSVTGPFDPDALSWDEIRELDRDPLITIGAHSKSHPVLSQVDAAQLEDEVLGSKRLLEEKLGHPVMHFAYPFGDHGQAGPREFKAAERAGFTSALTTRQGKLRAFHSRHPYSLPRVAVGFNDDLTTFRFKLSGIDSLFRRPQGLFSAR